jgi:hypothetical protein
MMHLPEVDGSAYREATWLAILHRSDETSVASPRMGGNQSRKGDVDGINVASLRDAFLHGGVGTAVADA